MSLMPGLVTHLIKHKYDVLHYHNYRHPLCDISAFIGKFNKSANILHGHGPFFEKGEISRGKHFVYNLYDRIAKKTILKWSDKIIALNEFEYDNFKKIINNEDRLTIIPNAAERESFNKTDPTTFINNYKLQNKKIILCLGIINAAKRQDLLVEALPVIIKEIPDAFLVLVGPDGGYLQKVKDAAARLNAEKYYKFIGPLMGDDKHKVYDAACIFALPSDKDAYPLVIAEAMAHYLPVVATDARGPKVMIHDGIDGYLLKKRDVKGIALAIIKLLKDENLRIKMGNNARINAERNHSAVRVVDDLLDIYYNILKIKNK
jgi:glycosyltransferase involved in cell wall biosynthesis